jgi:hypothetical protein
LSKFPFLVFFISLDSLVIYSKNLVSIMAAYNPHNFDLGQFMNDLFQQPDLRAQLQFLGNHLQVINSYVAAMEQELTRVTAITTAAQAQTQAQPGTLVAAPTSGTSKKLEVFADPGNFSGETTTSRNGG